MKILTVRQPWALHLIQSGKDVENRTRNVAGSYRGPVAIHASKTEELAALRRLPGRAPNGITRVFELGVIIGVADLIDVHHADTCRGTGDAGRLDEAFKATRDPRFTRLDAHRFCSPWAEPDVMHLVFAHPGHLVQPIPYKGSLGLQTLAPDIEAHLSGAAFVTYTRD